MKNFIMHNKLLSGIMLLLIGFIFIKDVYKGQLYDYGKDFLEIHQIGRSLFIQMPYSNSFYGYSSNSYQVTSDRKIIVGFYIKPIFLVGKNQSDIINIWLDYEGPYKLYYIGKNGEPTYLRDIKYSKEMDNICNILND